MRIGKNPQKFTDFVNYLLYTGRGKTKEVEQGKDLSGQLHSSKFLATLVMSVSWKHIREKAANKNQKKKVGNGGLIRGGVGCRCNDFIA